jgi:radical SAM superfamily enzyme YgiQ (UPF0313 family)
MKILFLNTLSGFINNPEVTPVAITRTIEGLDPSLGAEVMFVDVERYKLDIEEIRRRALAFRPDVIAYSACLTHAYKFVKSLSLELKSAVPGAIQVLGGQMAVISNILLQRTAVNFCVTGEAHPAFSQLLSALSRGNYRIDDMGPFKEIKGLCFMLDGIPYFTGYAPNTEYASRQINYDIVRKYSDINYYVQPVMGPWFAVRIDRRNLEYFKSLLRPENLSKNIVKVYSSKGCTNRCTFCHRFFSGQSKLDLDGLKVYLDKIIPEHNVGVVSFSDENFGIDRARSDALVDYLWQRGVNWTAGNVRARTITEEQMRYWKSRGCIGISAGIESLSEKTLAIMEKNTSIEQNLSAMRVLNDFGLYTGPMIIIGMPGETEETIEEAIGNICKVIPPNVERSFDIGSNWLQPVPGTAAYAFARATGIIGNSLDEEENYLLGLFGVNANERKHYVNFTNFYIEEISYWRNYLDVEVILYFMRKFGVLNTWRHKSGVRYTVAACLSPFPKPARKFLLKYAIMMRDYGIFSPLRLLVRRALSLKKRPCIPPVDAVSLRISPVLKDIQWRPDERYTAVLYSGR